MRYRLLKDSVADVFQAEQQLRLVLLVVSEKQRQLRGTNRKAKGISALRGL